MNKLKVGSWYVDPNHSLLTSESGKEVRIEPLNMALLCYLAKIPSTPVTKELLITDIWHDKVVTDHAVYKSINQLRKYLSSDGDQQDYIKTVPKKGYALVAAVENIVEVTAEEQISTSLEVTGASRWLKTFYKYPVVFTVLFLMFAATLAWFNGVGSYWSKLNFVKYDNITVNNLLPGIKEEIVPSATDKHLLVALKKDGLRGNRAVFIFHKETGQYYQLSDFKHDYSKLSWSKKGDKVVVSKRLSSSHDSDNCDLIIWSLNKEFTEVIAAQEITKCPTLGSSSFYDDEKEVLYYDFAVSQIHPSSLYKLNLKTGENNLLTNPGDASFGDWSIRVSPDYKTLAFIRVFDEHNELYKFDIETEQEEKLFSYFSYTDQISWSSDGENILFQVDGTEIWVYSLKYGYTKKIIANDDNHDWMYHSKVGNKIYTASTSSTMDIREVEVNEGLEQWRGSKEKTDEFLWRTNSPSADMFPEYKNDSNDFVFVSSRGGSSQVWYNEAGKARQLTNLQNTMGVVYFPKWSPNNKGLTFSNQGVIYSFDMQSEELTELYREDGTFAQLPFWALDNKSVYFTKVIDGRNEIFNVNIESKEIKQITTNGGFGAAISPDGQFMFIVKEDHLGLWRLNLTTLEEIKVSENVNLDTSYGLKASDKAISYAIDNDYRRSIFRLDYETLEETLIFSGFHAGFNYAIDREFKKILVQDTRSFVNKYITYESN